MSFSSPNSLFLQSFFSPNILTVFYEKEIELTPDWLTIIDMELLNLDEETILNIYSEIVEELSKEDNLENYFD